MGFGFGERLARRRKDKGLTQDALGKGLGTDGTDASKSVVYGWEKEQHYPRVDQLYQICEKLGCTADSLLLGRESSEIALTPEIAAVASEADKLPPKLKKRLLILWTSTLEIARDSLNPNGLVPESDARDSSKIPIKRKI